MTMFTIPTDLDRWAPADVTEWLHQVVHDEDRTPEEIEAAGHAADRALLPDERAARTV
jgi:hypothetical protein